MKLKYVGLFLIAIGFAAPYILRIIFPVFTYASVISGICFWAGFLSILRPIDHAFKYNSHLKWASFAIWLNILITLFWFIYIYFLFNLELYQGIWSYAIHIFGFAANPIQSIFDKIVSPPTVQLPDGSIEVTNTFIRSLLTHFFDLVFYAFAGIFAKFLKDKMITSVFSGSQRPCAR